MCAVGFVDVGLALPADASRAVGLDLHGRKLGGHEGALFRILCTDDPIVGDTSGVSEDGAHKGNESEHKQYVEHRHVGSALACQHSSTGGATCHQCCGGVLQRQQHVIQIDAIAPRDDQDDKGHGQPSADGAARASGTAHRGWPERIGKKYHKLRLVGLPSMFTKRRRSYSRLYMHISYPHL